MLSKVIRGASELLVYLRRETQVFFYKISLLSFPRRRESTPPNEDGCLPEFIPAKVGTGMTIVGSY
jgi:hypothetical protein